MGVLPTSKSAGHFSWDQYINRDEYRQGRMVIIWLFNGIEQKDASFLYH